MLTKAQFMIDAYQVNLSKEKGHVVAYITGPGLSLFCNGKDFMGKDGKLEYLMTRSMARHIYSQVGFSNASSGDTSSLSILLGLME